MSSWDYSLIDAQVELDAHRLSERDLNSRPPGVCARCGETERLSCAVDPWPDSGLCPECGPAQ